MPERNDVVLKNSRYATLTVGSYSIPAGGRLVLPFDEFLALAAAASLDVGGLVIEVGQLTHEHMLSARDFGAYGDGYHDDTDSITKAMDAAQEYGYAGVFFPSGTYMVSTLTVPSNISLVGSAAWDSTIKLMNGVNADLIQTPRSTSNVNTSFENLVFDGNKANNTTSDVLDLYGLSYGLVRRCKIINGKVRGIILYGGASNAATGTIIRDCYISGCDGDGVYVGQYASNSSIHGGRVVSCSQGLNAADTNYLNVIGLMVSNSQLHGVRLYGVKNAVLQSLQVAYSSLASSNVSSAIYIDGASSHSSTHINISACVLGTSVDANEHMKYGIADSGSTYVTDLVIVGNTASGADTAPIGINATASKIVSANSWQPKYGTTAAIPTGYTGDIYYDTTVGSLYVFNGSTWARLDYYDA